MKKLIMLSLLLASLSSCVSGLSNSEKIEYEMYKKKSMDLDTKNKYVGLGLGFLPGGGSFYTGNTGIGIADLLLWPFSILWDPFNGYNGSEKINYQNTKEFVNKKKEMEVRDLTAKFESGGLSQKDYIIQKQKIDDKYSSNF